MYSIWKLSKVYLPPLKNVNRIASCRCCVRLESGPPPDCRRKVVSASTQDGAAGKDLEAHRCWWFVSLERWIDRSCQSALFGGASGTLLRTPYSPNIRGRMPISFLAAALSSV